MAQPVLWTQAQLLTRPRTADIGGGTLELHFHSEQCGAKVQVHIHGSFAEPYLVIPVRELDAVDLHGSTQLILVAPRHCTPTGA